MPEISSEVYQQVRAVLEDCAPMGSNDELRAIFRHPKLKPWRSRLPEAGSLMGRVDAVVAYLSDRYNIDNENALLLLLAVLSAMSEEGDACGSALMQVAERLAVDLGTTVPAIPRGSVAGIPLPRSRSGNPTTIIINASEGSVVASRDINVDGDLQTGGERTEIDSGGGHVVQNVNTGGGDFNIGDRTDSHMQKGRSEGSDNDRSKNTMKVRESSSLPWQFRGNGWCYTFAKKVKKQDDKVMVCFDGSLPWHSALKYFVYFSDEYQGHEVIQLKKLNNKTNYWEFELDKEWTQLNSGWDNPQLWRVDFEFQ